jgi:putative RecB family exonuclease
VVSQATFAQKHGDKASSDRNYISYSALSLFAACPLRYFFKYIAGLPEEIIGASLLFGAGIHSALEFHFRELMAGKPPPGLDVLLDAFWSRWHDHDGQTIQFAKGDDINTIGRLAERVLLAFQSSDFARPTGTIIGVEEELRGALIPGLPDLLARIDLLIDTGDALVVHDFKTARSRWSEQHVADSAGQILLYHELVKKSATKTVRLVFTVLTKSKFPELVLHPVHVDHQQIERAKRIVERIWKAIKHGHFYPNPSAINCSTCPFRRPCREWIG